MHPALEVHEILLNIFGHCYPPDAWEEASNLAVLARTCRAFKEPALDILWEELRNLAPLARCLPEVFQSQSSTHRCYTAHKPLTEIEWDILQSYTRRIRSVSMKDLIVGLDQESIKTLSKPPAGEPLFPNLRHLSFDYTPQEIPLLRIPFPSLISLDLMVYDEGFIEDSLKDFAKIAPNIKSLSTEFDDDIDMSKIGPSFISQWRNLETVKCYKTSLDADTLVYLSRVPALTRLSFTLRSTLPDQIPTSNSPLDFSNLQELCVNSPSLPSLSRLLSRTRLPAITHFCVRLEDRPSGQDVSILFTALRTSGAGHFLQELWFSQAYTYGFTHDPDPRPSLDLEDLQPCMAFRNLRSIDFNIECTVNLTDRELLKLASAWPDLEVLRINKEWGWNTIGGITPNGLLQLLGKCQSLDSLALAIDTRGYTEFHESTADPERDLPCVSHIDVADSFIEEESVPAIAAFFGNIILDPQSSLKAWDPWSSAMSKSPHLKACYPRWHDVQKQVVDAAGQSS